MRRNLWLIAAVLLIGVWAWTQQSGRAPAAGSSPDTAQQDPRTAAIGRDGPAGERTRNDTYPAFLPREAHDVLRRIATGGPFDHRQDGGTFQNRENRLPKQPRGYYREYTVQTPGSDDRGARRIVTGGDPPSEYFYSDDHYRSFRRFDAAAEGASR
jgi:ribonuclease T1